MTESDSDALIATIEQYLADDLPKASELAPQLVEAMRYATLGGGKRLRPALVCATATSLGASLDAAIAPAAAVEYMHTYSLVHDDLPAMDDDELRRGRATCHVAFDETTAILVGDALQTLAFETLAGAPLNAELRIRMVELLTDAAGWQNMVAGQALDMEGTGERELSIEQLHALHVAKTGAMFRVAVQIGCVVAGHHAGDIFDALTRYGNHIGLAFQVVDDILDVTQTTEQLGKPAGSDERAGKSTYPAILGLDESRAFATELLGEGIAILDEFGLGQSTLAILGQRTVERVN